MQYLDGFARLEHPNTLSENKNTSRIYSISKSYSTHVQVRVGVASMDIYRRYWCTGAWKTLLIRLRVSAQRNEIKTAKKLQGYANNRKKGWAEALVGEKFSAKRWRLWFARWFHFYRPAKRFSLAQNHLAEVCCTEFSSALSEGIYVSDHKLCIRLIEAPHDSRHDLCGRT